MDYFTSDLHIGHNKDFIWKSRGFSSIEEHNTTILKNWNAVVTPDDTVYLLGDLCLGEDKEEWDRIYKHLNGNKIVIIGNHDTKNKIDKYESDYHMSCLGYATIYQYSKKRVFYLSHYPTLVGNYDNKKFLWNLSGHTHSTKLFQYENEKIYNVAMDAHNCTPVSIEQIIKDIEKYRQEHINES